MEEDYPKPFTPPDDLPSTHDRDYSQDSFAPAEQGEAPAFFDLPPDSPPLEPAAADTSPSLSLSPEEVPPPEAPVAPASNKILQMPGWLKGMSLSGGVKWALMLIIGGWVYSNCHHDRPPQYLAEHYTFPESKFVPVGGMEVHCRTVGRGMPMLLLHDANSSLHTWSGWDAALAGKYQLISVDLPGFGLTGPHPQGSYSAFMYHAFLDSLVQQLHLSRFYLAGNGLGAEIAWFYAAERPKQVDKLILLGAPGLEPKSSSDWVQWAARTPVLNRVLWSVTPRSYVRLMLEDIYADDALVTDSLVQRHFDLLLAPGNRHAFTDRASVSDNRPPVSLIDSITTPTLILWGAEDTRIAPEFAYEFHQRIRGALLRIYQNTGHWPQEENPARTARDVEAFLEGKF